MSVHFGQFVLLKRLAIGGMAEIFLASRSGSDGFSKKFVVKLMLPNLEADPEFVQMFVEEAKLVAGMPHPHIAQVYELGVIEGRHFIAMEYVAGVDLATLLAELAKGNERLPLATALTIIGGILLALHFAHEQRDEDGHSLGLVHRDVSPHNVLLSTDGAIKLTDFGIAKASSSSHKTRTGVIKGKLAYIAPEQALGTAVDRRTDLFAAALIWLELLTGTRVYADGNELQLMQRAARADIPALPDTFSAALRAVSRQALSFAPDDRFASTHEFWRALQEAAGVDSADAVHIGALVRRFAHSPDSLPDLRSLTFVGDASAPTHTSTLPVVRKSWVRAIAAACMMAVVAAFLVTRPTPPAAPILTPEPASLPSSAPPSAPVVPVSAPTSVGYLTVNAMPWAYVWIDGKKQRQMTPIQRLPMSVGHHRVTLSNPGLHLSAERSVDISAGHVSTVLVDLNH